MPERADLPWEIERCNAYYKDPARRAWALVAFMFEHEAHKVLSDGTTQQRQVDGNGRLLFGANELNKQLVRAGAGYGGYRHVGAAGISRSDVIRAMAADAEREGWITRARYRYGGLYNYALTEAGRNFYRSTIKPQRDAFLGADVKITKLASNAGDAHVAKVPATRPPKHQKSV